MVTNVSKKYYALADHEHSTVEATNVSAWVPHNHPELEYHGHSLIPHNHSELEVPNSLLFLRMIEVERLVEELSVKPVDFHIYQDHFLCIQLFFLDSWGCDLLH